ncbi:MAG: hypothetical protein ACREHV_10425 [Rhizomicrobium sp.]
MKRCCFTISPSYSRVGAAVAQAPSIAPWMMLPAVALALMTFACVWVA